MDVSPASTDLDPSDWEAFSREAHAALDLMIDHLRSVRTRPVWQPTPADVEARLCAGLPRDGADFADVVGRFARDILPYGTGNLHPLFLGWVHGAGTPYGMVAEMLAAGLNANCGGRNHAAIGVERQIALWAAEMFGYPETASGLFVTGTSMANFLGLLVARTAALGTSARAEGLCEAGAQLTLYASQEAHGCIRQAAELAGIGSNHLRVVATLADGTIDPAALRGAIAADRRAGLTPFLVVGTAGSVNTGAIDDLAALADIAEEEGLWFHVDGAFGALIALSPALASRLAGIERSHSVGFDFHKWAHVPYDAGFLIVRDGAAHKAAFAHPQAYLQRQARGVGAGETWPCDLGPDLSRGFRALKTWMTLSTLGTDRIGRSIEACCALARNLEVRLAGSPLFEPAAAVSLNIVCFRLRDPFLRHHHAEIVMDLHERGVAVPSLTTIAGETVIRAAFVNHRTTEDDVACLVAEAEASARSVLAASAVAPACAVPRAARG